LDAVARIIRYRVADAIKELAAAVNRVADALEQKP
jgi:hypothetical protein